MIYEPPPIMYIFIHLALKGKYISYVVDCFYCFVILWDPPPSTQTHMEAYSL